MRQVAFWSSYGRSAGGVAAAACLAFAMAGCSSGASRASISRPSISPATIRQPPPRMPITPRPRRCRRCFPRSRSTAPAVVIQQYARTSLPPSYTPRPTDAAFSPASSGRLGAQHANYGAQAAPAPQQAVVRTARAAGYRVKVAKGDTLSTLSRRYGVSVEEIMSANNLPDGRLSVGQELVIPGVTGPKAIQAEATPTSAPASAPASGQSTYKVAEGRHAARHCREARRRRDRR